MECASCHGARWSCAKYALASPSATMCACAFLTAAEMDAVVAVWLRDETLWRELQCVVCKTAMVQAYAACHEGHASVCMPCFQRLEKCPVCTGNLSRPPTRLRPLEAAAQHVAVPCPYDGCARSLRHADLGAHVAACDAKPLVCGYTACTARVSARDTNDHYHTAHIPTDRNALLKGVPKTERERCDVTATATYSFPTNADTKDVVWFGGCSALVFDASTTGARYGVEFRNTTNTTRALAVFALRQLTAPQTFRLAHITVRFGTLDGAHMQFILKRAITFSERIDNSIGTSDAVYVVDLTLLRQFLVSFTHSTRTELKWRLTVRITATFVPT